LLSFYRREQFKWCEYNRGNQQINNKPIQPYRYLSLKECGVLGRDRFEHYGRRQQGHVQKHDNFLLGTLYISQ
jgi:hypothetical protein